MTGDPDEEDQRTRVNLFAAVAVLLIAIAAFFVFNRLDEQRRLQRCVDSGRRDCFALPTPPTPPGGRP